MSAELRVDINPEEREEISRMMEGKGWQTLVTKVWAVQRELARNACCSNVIDRSRTYEQGYYFGFECAFRSALENSRADALVIAGGEPDEASLMARSGILKS